MKFTATSDLLEPLRAILGCVSSSPDLNQSDPVVRDFREATARLMAKLIEESREPAPARDTTPGVENRRS